MSKPKYRIEGKINILKINLPIAYATSADFADEILTACNGFDTLKAENDKLKEEKIDDDYDKAVMKLKLLDNLNIKELEKEIKSLKESHAEANKLLKEAGEIIESYAFTQGSGRSRMKPKIDQYLAGVKRDTEL